MLGVQTAMPTMTKCTLYLEEACCIATHRCAGHKLTGMVSCTLPDELNECPVQDVKGAIGLLVRLTGSSTRSECTSGGLQKKQGEQDQSQGLKTCSCDA